MPAIGQSKLLPSERGAFAERAYKKRDILCNFLARTDFESLSLEELQAQCEVGIHNALWTHRRVHPDFYIIRKSSWTGLANSTDWTSFVNHSPQPNLAWIFGVLYAGRDIEPGEELFMDYRVLSPALKSDGSPNFQLIDASTGEPQLGLSESEYLVEQARVLNELVKD